MVFPVWEYASLNASQVKVPIHKKLSFWCVLLHRATCLLWRSAVERSFILPVITLGPRWRFSATMDCCLNRYVGRLEHSQDRWQHKWLRLQWCKESLCCMFCVSVWLQSLCCCIFVCVGAVHGIWWGLLWFQPWLCHSNWFPWRSVWSPYTTSTFWRQRLWYPCRKVCSQSFLVKACEST